VLPDCSLCTLQYGFASKRYCFAMKHFRNALQFFYIAYLFFAYANYYFTYETLKNCIVLTKRTKSKVFLLEIMASGQAGISARRKKWYARPEISTARPIRPNAKRSVSYAKHRDYHARRIKSMQDVSMWMQNE